MDAIPGLTYIPAYLSASEQNRLLTVIDQNSWMTELNRRVQQYGFAYDYRKRWLDPSTYLGALPYWADALAERLYADGFFPAPPQQVIVNEYLPGQGIAAHVDCVPCFGDTVVSLSLGSSCVIDFTPLKRAAEASLLLEPRSLLVMQGAARYDWKHSIAPRKTDLVDGLTMTRGRRVSLTFRNVVF